MGARRLIAAALAGNLAAAVLPASLALGQDADRLRPSVLQKLPDPESDPSLFDRAAPPAQAIDSQEVFLDVLNSIVVFSQVGEIPDEDKLGDELQGFTGQPLISST